MAKYELTIVFSKDNSKTVTKTITDNIKASNAEVVSKDDWGVRPLAYMINKHTEAQYLHFILEMDETKAKQLEQKVKLEEQLLRYLLVKVS